MRVNDRIRTAEVRLIGPDGSQLGVMTPREALRIAEENGLDLIEVAPDAAPPVCRIMDYGKYKYEKAKKEREAQRKQQHGEIKGIRIRPRTDTHDFQTKVRNAQKFLEQGHKVKVTCMFRGREMAHREIGEGQLLKLAEELADVAVIEMRPSLQGRMMNMVLAPR